MLTGAFKAMMTLATLILLPQLALAQAYTAKPGDSLQIEILEDASLSRQVLVTPDGFISFPLVGAIQAKGRSVSQIAAALRNGLAPNFATPPSVHVAISELAAPTGSVSSRTIDVFALGEIETSGRLEVGPKITLLQFLAEAGGLGDFAADKRIELIRTDKKTGAITTYLFNYRMPTGSATTISGSTYLHAGDVIKVPQKRLFE